jgi:hypothetical protein
MDRLCMIMHRTTLCTPCIANMLVSHTCIFAIDHAEQGSEEQPEPAQVEGVDPEKDQGKSRCIEPPFLEFILSIYILIMILECALGYRS